MNQVGPLLLTWEKQEESTLLYGLSYNSPYKTPHNKRMLDEKEERRKRPSQPGGSSG
jgi:hypothetical protein